MPRQRAGLAIQRRARQAVLAPPVVRAPSATGSAGSAGSAESAESIEKLLRDIRWELQQQRRYLEIQRLHSTAPVLDQMQAFTAERQLSLQETLLRIGRDGLSFARFGDGELRMMLRSQYDVKFQRNNPAIRKELEELLTTGNVDGDKLLLGFPQVFRDMHWSGVWADLWPQLSAMLPAGQVFGNSQVSRPFFFQQLGDEGVQLWRNIWNGLNICIITGAGSRFELVPELFDNVKSVRFLHSVPSNAYADLPHVLRNVRTGRHADLYLVALGPAGTLLAARLAQMGLRAIDIGQVGS